MAARVELVRVPAHSICFVCAPPQRVVERPAAHTLFHFSTFAILLFMLNVC